MKKYILSLIVMIIALSTVILFNKTVHADVNNHFTVKNEYLAFKVKSKHNVYLTNEAGKKVEKLSNTTTYYMPKSYGKLGKIVYLSAYDNKLNYSGHVKLSQLKKVPVKISHFYESPLEKRVQKLFKGTILDQNLQFEIKNSADNTAQSSGDYFSDFSSDIYNNYPRAQFLMSGLWDNKKKQFKGLTQNQIFAKIKQQLRKEMPKGNKFSSYNGYHIAVQVYKQHNYSPYSAVVVLNKPDTSTTNWTNTDIYNHFDQINYQKKGSHFNSQLNSLASEYGSYLTAGDIDTLKDIDRLLDGSNISKKLNLQKYVAHVTVVNLNDMNQFDSVVAKLSLIPNANTGISLQLIPGTNTLSMVQLYPDKYYQGN